MQVLRSQIDSVIEVVRTGGVHTVVNGVCFVHWPGDLKIDHLKK